MGADLSRVRFDALRDHAGVVLQQGRLLLDSDWNELVAIFDRRLRADALDLGSEGPKPGIAGVAVVPRTTPDAFKITAAAGAITIGRGRMYVDGLLAQNHGIGPGTFEPLLTETVGTSDTPYSQQPYWPTPAALPTTGIHLVYLDVWSREVTQLEAPDLIEPALGVDTTARMQTVWQVRVHAPDTPGVDCSTPDEKIPGWPAVIAPSAGRLSTGTIPVTDTDDPCALPPTGGYRGLENQTYRVEIHDAGAPGTATFKWSQNNASVASPVVEVVSPTTIRPASLGKDDVLRFTTGNWVEIVDDVREFDQAPGEIRQIQVHEEDSTLTFTPALPADLVLTPTQAAARHLRVRRWDQSGQILDATGTKLDNLDAAGSPGVIKVPTGGMAVVLESGLTVALTAPGGVFRTGDHWIFAARTAGTSVEDLVNAPPLGIHHHYARLGMVTFPDTATDCRTLWPADCNCNGGGCSDCTVCVTPQSHASGALTIQDAVTTVTPAGGTVCLAAGIYHLGADGVRIENAVSVTVRGEGPKTLLITPGRGIQVTSSSFVTLEDFAVVGTEKSPTVQARATVAFTAQRLTLLVIGAAGAPASGIALGGLSLLTRLRDNAVIAPVGISGGSEKGAPLLTAALDISANLLFCAGSGTRFDGRVAHLLGNAIADNTILRATATAVRALGLIGPGATFTVSGNTIITDSAGIEVGATGFTLRDNEIDGTEQSQKGTGEGISVLPGTFGSLRGLTRVTGNHVRDVGGVGIAVSAPVADLAVAHNVVERALEGIVMGGRVGATAATVSDNVIRDVGARLSEAGGVSGIQIVGAARADVESNTVSGVGAARTARDGSAGIRVLGCAESRVAGNSVDRVGFDEAPGTAVGIQIAATFSRTEVDGNFCRRSDAAVDDDVPSEWTGLQIGERKPGDAVTVTHFGAFTSVQAATSAYLIGAKTAFGFAPTEVSAIVSANTVTGGGRAPATLIVVPGDAVVANNQSRQTREAAFASVELAASSATVSANRARGGRPSMDLTVDPKRVAVLGNITSLGITVAGNPLGAPWVPLNPDGVV
jgi:hypothetical protein